MMGTLLPVRLVSALSVALFGMFIAVFIPPAKKDKVVLGCVAVSFAAALLFDLVPFLREISAGTRTILLTVIIAAYISCRTMMNLVMRISGKKEAALISGAAYLFSNYHIADIYIRGALGEVFALAVLPAVLDGLYQILIEGREDGWFTLALSIGSLALCHNLTFALGSLLTAFLSVVFVKRLNRKTFYALFKGVGFAFLITAFYTLPMIEQLKSQTLIVDYFASGSDLSAYSIDLWQYFANKTVFATAGNWKEAGDTMLVNVGYFLQFVPLLYFFFAKEQGCHCLPDHRLCDDPVTVFVRAMGLSDAVKDSAVSLALKHDRHCVIEHSGRHCVCGPFKKQSSYLRSGADPVG